jgi:outer membrane protein assembly factor BamB
LEAIVPSLSHTSMSIAVVVPMVLATAVRAEDWPQWRGPNRDNVWAETGVVETFPLEGLKVRWRAAVGPGWSSPVVAQGRVFLTDSQLKRPQAKERVLCFDQATGKPAWTYAYEASYPDWAFTPGQEPGPCATPVVEAGRVYTLGGSGQVLCLDARTGERLWERRLDKAYEIEVLKCRASPLIDGGLLILFVGGKPGACVVALDKRSGQEAWKALDESVTNSSPIIVTAGGKRQLIVWTGESVTSLDPAMGKAYWRERLVTSNNDAIATPVWNEPLLLIGGLMLKLDAMKPAASVLWRDTKAVSRRVLSNTSTAVLRGGYVFSARSSGELVCLETGGTYGGTYGPEDIAGDFFMFLDYFLPHKVICGSGTEKAAPAVIRKLAKWLVAKGYDPDAADAVE